MSYTKCLGGSSRILPPTTHYGADKVLLCAVLINFPVGFKDLQQLCLTPICKKHRDPVCSSHGMLASFAPHKSAGGSSSPVMAAWEESLASVRNNSDHNRKRNSSHSFKPLGSSSTFQLQKNSSSSTYVKASAPSLCALYT